MDSPKLTSRSRSLLCDVSPSNVVMLETKPVKSHRCDRPSLHWARTGSIDIPKWKGKAQKVSTLYEELQGFCFLKLLILTYIYMIRKIHQTLAAIKSHKNMQLGKRNELHIKRRGFENRTSTVLNCGWVHCWILICFLGSIHKLKTISQLY